MPARHLPSVVDLLLGALDPPERDVVAGDLCELGLTGPRAAGEVLGLIARRQLAAWCQWRPWAALALIALPPAMMLSLLTRHWADVAAFSSWFYIDNWTHAYLDSPAARGDLFDAVTTTAVQCAALVVWAWTAGCALASLSRRTVWTSFAVFAAVVFCGTIGTTTLARSNSANAIVFSSAVYSSGLPILFRVALVLLPAAHGIRRAGREPALGLAPGIATATLAVVVTALVWKGTGSAVRFGWRWSSADGQSLMAIRRFRDAWLLRWLPFALLIPAFYVVLRATRPPRALR